MDQWRRRAEHVPVAWYEDLAERLGGEGHELVLHGEHGAAVVIAAAEGDPRDGLLRHLLEPLRHVHLHLAASAGRRHRPPLIRQRGHGSADVGHQPLQNQTTSLSANPPVEVWNRGTRRQRGHGQENRGAGEQLDHTLRLSG
jgi:hypothetical protein